MVALFIRHTSAARTSPIAVLLAKSDKRIKKPAKAMLGLPVQRVGWTQVAGSSAVFRPERIGNTRIMVYVYQLEEAQKGSQAAMTDHAQRNFNFG